MTLKRKSTQTEEPSSKFLMGLAPDHCLSHGEDAEFVLTSDEIRAIAAEIESDEINGQSDREQMETYLKGHTRV